MQKTLRVLNVFLASPDDVRPERAAAEELVTELNKILGKNPGWDIWLHKWEDTPPASGRPQEIINAAVDGCSLFIGLLWERWGQPTGRYSSGFEEEYERARARRKATHEPEIWLIFKRVDPDRLNDPGPQLSKVLEFRRAQVALGEVLFKEVTDVDDWRKRLKDWLLDYVLNLSAPPPVSQPPVSAPQPEALEASATGFELSDVEIEPAVPEELREVSNALAGVVNSRELEFSRQDAKLLGEREVARLYLLSATWMSGRYTGTTLGTHEINLLYKHRKRFFPAPPESFLLLRTVVSDGSDVVPGWWWCYVDADGIGDWLLSLVIHDSSIEVRRRALGLLLKAGIRLPNELLPGLPLLDDDMFLRGEAYRYLALFGDEGTVASLEELAAEEDAPISSDARDARLSILTRIRPESALREIVKEETYVSDDSLRDLQGHIGRVEDDDLLKGLDSQWEKVRELCANELARRGHLSGDVAQRLTGDPSLAIRQIGFMELANRGEQLDLGKVEELLSSTREGEKGTPYLAGLAGLLGSKSEPKGDPDAVILAFYRRQSSEVALKDVDWFLLKGALAYRSLATDHYDAIRDRLRSDLENGFARVRQESIDATTAQYGAKFSNELEDRFKSLDDFVRSRFVDAALAGLALNGEPSDIRFGRQWLASERSTTRLEAIKVVCRFGSAEDVPRLLQIAKEEWGESRDEAGVCALRLAERPLEVARELINSSSSKLLQVAFDWLFQHPSPEVDGLFEGFVTASDEKTRVRAVHYFYKTAGEKKIASLLESQFQREAYYYNVVTWIDRLLHAPGPLKEYFAGELEREARS